MSIRVQSICKNYGTQKAVDQLSFEVAQGEIVGFLGPNGAGKSTTMKILTGYLQPDSGSAWVEGISVREQPLEAKKHVGYLPEANPLYTDMYVREYLGFVCDLHHLSAKSQKIDQAIQQVGLGPERSKKIGQLSKGYKQRVGLAAALIHDPEVLVLDEPTSGLDPNQIVEIREVIRRMGSEKTVLFSSHILQEVEALCDRVIILYRGKLVADQSLEALRHHFGQNQVTVRFAEGVEETLFQGLAGISGLERRSASHWEMRSSDPAALRKHLMQRALENNLNIVSLQSENQSLEEVFRTLTAGSESQDPTNQPTRP